MNETRTNETGAVPPAVTAFLRGLQTGEWDGMEGFLTPDVLYDATVPGWRYQYEGVERVVREYREEWTGRHPWRVAECQVHPTPDGAVVDLEARAGSPGAEEAFRQANIFRLDGGRIAEHRFYCCGEWDDATLRAIDEGAPKVRRAATVAAGR